VILNEVIHSKDTVAKHGSRSLAALERRARPAVRTQSLTGDWGAHRRWGL